LLMIPAVAFVSHVVPRAIILILTVITKISTVTFATVLTVAIITVSIINFITTTDRFSFHIGSKRSSNIFSRKSTGIVDHFKLYIFPILVYKL
jgi:hypothetical protein